MQEKSTLRIAIQKSGRLNEESVNLLQSIGLSFIINERTFITKCDNFDIEIMLLRNSDIPIYLEKGICDLAIIGENSLLEKEVKVEKLLNLGFGKCRFSLAGKSNIQDFKIKDLQGKIIATSYPNTVKNYLMKNRIHAQIIEISGSTEIAPLIGISDFIADLVSSGDTLKANGLRELVEIFVSEGVCAKTCMPLNDEKEVLIKKLVFRMEALLNAQKSKYLVMNAPKEALKKIINIFPGLESPTVTALGKNEWYLFQWW